jgi:kumamolisin
MVAVGPSDPEGLEALAASVSAPGGPAHGHYLGPGAIATRFGASSSALAVDRAYFDAFGLSSTVSPDRFFLELQGDATEVGAAFHTALDVYSSPGRTFFSHPTPATVPADLGVLSVLGLGNTTVIEPTAMRVPGPLPAVESPKPDSGCSASSYLPPCALWTAYNFSGLVQEGENGSGTRIGVVDVYDSAETQPMLESDLQNFTVGFGLPSVSPQFAYPVPAGNSLNTSGSDGWALEEALDLEWSHASAPGAAITMALAANSNAALYGAVDALVAEDQVNVLSLSWGEPDVGIFNAVFGGCAAACNASSDGSYAILHPVLAAAAVEGISVFVASGDCGASDGTSGLSTDYPSSDPWSTGVGGTELTTDSSGNYGSEVAWSGNSSGLSGCENQGGSGGGYSPFPRPYWQAGTGISNTETQRGDPDVSINAVDPAPVVQDGYEFGATGTSLACPSWAGIAAIADQVAGHPLGFLDPSLYQILRNGSYGRAFHDITSGSNGYPAGTGWDPVTGLGSPKVDALIPLLVGSHPTYSDLFARLSASIRSGNAPLTVHFSTVVSGGTAPYAGYDFYFGDGNATFAGGNASSHVYANAGVFNASVTVFDAGANSTTSVPLTIVVGGAQLTVSLTANRTAVPVGGSVQFEVTVSGGFGPYSLGLWFGDGTYSIPSSSFTWTHAYASAGGFCAAAVASDAQDPADGGSSPPVALQVGGAAAPPCLANTPLFANLTSAVTAADLPGDLPLAWNASGGTGALTTAISSTDPYADLCGCGVFHTAGNQSVTLTVTDTSGDRTSRTLDVTLYPALVGNFSASTQSGPAPLTVTFSASARGGEGANAARTNWSFGDGAFATGASVTHTYTSEGRFIALAQLSDAGGGNASSAILIDVTGATSSGLVVTGSIGPALRAELGAPTQFSADALGGVGGYTYLWNFSDGSSAFGPAGSEAVDPGGTGVPANYTFGVSLTVRDSVGDSTSWNFTLGPYFAGRWSVLRLTESPGARSGLTPFEWVSSLAASGMPGTTVSWQFGDGGTENGPSADHTFDVPGNYTVFGAVADAGGDLWVRAQAVQVGGSVIQPLAVAVTFAEPWGFVGWPVGLHVNVSGGAGAYNYSVAWGDGQSGFSGPWANHSYADPGSYTVRVNVTDPGRQAGSASAALRVYNSTAVLIHLAAPEGAEPDTANFTLDITVAPRCGAASVPNCTRAPVPLELWVRINNSSASPYLGYAIPPAAPGVAVPFSFLAPPEVGVIHVVVFAAGPNFTGFAAIELTVLAPPSTSSGLGSAEVAGLFLLLFGAFAGLATAEARVMLETGRRPPRRPGPAGATPRGPASP